MPAQWTADLLAQMHMAKVTAKQLAQEASMNPKYLSTILNGHVEPKGAQQKLEAAFKRLAAKSTDSR